MLAPRSTPLTVVRPLEIAMDLIKAIRREYGLDIKIHDEQALLAVKNLTQNLENACRRYVAAKPFIRNNLTMSSLSEELYSRASHFALELIQNADDDEYAVGERPTLHVELKGSEMIVQCNEKGFTEKNVRAICSIGKSTKKDNSGYIGQFDEIFTLAQ